MMLTSWRKPIATAPITGDRSGFNKTMTQLREQIIKSELTDYDALVDVDDEDFLTEIKPVIPPTNSERITLLRKLLHNMRKVFDLLYEILIG